MDQSNKNPKQFSVIPKWSELCPDLLQCVFERLSFTKFNRAKSVCRSWNSVLIRCVPKQRNQIPWLILFPQEEEETKSNSNRCALYVPDDEEKVYWTRDLGFGFRKSPCLATHGSWLLMYDQDRRNLYILNPLTLERIDLPSSLSICPYKRPLYSCNRACFWVDDITKDYLVVWSMDHNMVFTKKCDGTWRNVHPSGLFGSYAQIVYNHKDDKVYTCDTGGRVAIWDFSGDIPRQDGYLATFRFSALNFKHSSSSKDILYWCIWSQIATNISGQVLYVRCFEGDSKWQLRIYKPAPLGLSWVEVDSLGDEALILDMGFTVVAKDIPGIQRNSIYFSGHGYGIARDDPDQIFVYDLTTRTVEHLPQRVFSSIPFSHARWFFPDFTV